MALQKKRPKFRNLNEELTNKIILAIYVHINKKSM